VASLALASACSSSDDDDAADATTTTAPVTPTTPATTATAVPDGDIAEQVDIGGGRTIYVECHGEGSPTVLLLSGGGTASDLWHAPEQTTPNVYDTIGAETRVCALDRPGVMYLDGSPSRSTPVAQPITPQSAAADLDAVLDALDMHGPYVLAAHSFAGNIARVFAADHPDDVTGIVFVDVLSPELRAAMTADEWRTWVGANNRTPEQLAEYPDLEQYDFDISLDQVEAAEAADPPAEIPVVVLTASVKFVDLVPLYLDEGLLPPDVPRDFGATIDRTNTVAQTALAAHYPGSVLITDTDSGHNIMIENSPIVIQAIDDVLTAARAGATTPTPATTAAP
jgi:pimeloyl-ACP methyl ester carboxylesterase